MNDRRTELAANLAILQAQIADDCARAGRHPSEVTVIAVSKTWPSSDIRLLHELGVRDFGENRDQEAQRKAEELADLSLRWHFIGQLQTNKAKHVASYANMVHSVDRIELIRALQSAASPVQREIDCLLQVSLDPAAPAGRGGVQPIALAELAKELDAAAPLRLAGLMAVVPLGMPTRDAFRRLMEVRAGFLAEFPTARILSAGMSGDFAEAISAGATHLRIGSILLGNRPQVG